MLYAGVIPMKIYIPELAWSPYGLLVLTSVAIGFAVAIYLMRKAGVTKHTILYTCILTSVFTVTNSVMGNMLISNNPRALGFSGLGAVVGIILGVLVSGLIIKDKPESVMASFIATAPLMYGLAKTGCLFGGCCHGKEYEGPFAIVYSGANGGSYFPAQIIDMVVFIAMFVINLILIRKMKNKIAAIYVILALLTVVRFLLEYLKYYHDGSLIASGQVSVLVAGAASIVLVTVWKFLLKVGKAPAAAGAQN